MPSSPESLPKQKQSAGHKAILEAAADLFSHHGFDGVSMRQIADSAGVSKANIYHHFSSKNELYLAIFLEGAQNLSEIVEVLGEGEGGFEQRLRKFARSHLNHLFVDSATLKLILREAFSGDEETSQMVADQVVGGVFSRMASIFRAGQEAGQLRNDIDPALCASLIIGSNLFFFQAQGVLAKLPDAEFAENADVFSQQMANVLLDGMLSRSREQGEQP